MALGVLNNLSAVYAENNLNNTNASLQKVLQQLSSGSRINSGADDAAGLSLVNGLEANSVALTQSSTNATEGVGLLQVADGALSQVTNLLDRAITLATEASNGTLNSTQLGAANQEYQSILAEVNNIGSTTTYNQQQVFAGSTVAIYTGDSSQAGSSVDDLYVRALSASSVGDTGGAMSYSSGQTNVFIDLSNGGTNASAFDSLNASGSTTITVNYLAKGTTGNVTPATANITVGTGTNYSNTAQGLINAINDSGLGLSASFGTAAQAGSGAVSVDGAANSAGGSSSDTGIIISGTGVGTGTDSPGEVGALTLSNSTATLTGGSVSITDAAGKTHVFTLGLANSTDTLANLAATINAADLGVTATVNASFLNGTAPNTVLTFTSPNENVSVSTTSPTASVGTITLGGTPTPDGTPYTNVIGTVTLNTAGDTLTGGVLAMGSNSLTITPGDTLAQEAALINKANYGVTASVDATDKVLTISSANASMTFSATTAVTETAGGPTVTTNNAANQNQIGTVAFTNAAAVAGDSTSGNIVIDGSTFAGGAGITLGALATQITNSSIGVTATVNAAPVTIGGHTYAAGTYMTLVANGSAAHGAQWAAGSTINDATSAGVTRTQDTPAVSSANYFNIGISGSVTDTSTNGGMLNTGTVSNSNGSGGVATMGYSDSAGESLSGTSLDTQQNAQTALGLLNIAIGDVASLDGYIGAQINTLNSISQIMSTQQENVVSAQNAIQATDYAAATSNMSKYEILSQTGIAALAQANSVEQEVLKLLQ
jgi:flagellin